MLKSRGPSIDPSGTIIVITGGLITGEVLHLELHGLITGGVYNRGAGGLRYYGNWQV